MFIKKPEAKGNSRPQPAHRRGLLPPGGNRGSAEKPTELQNSPEMTFNRFECTEVTELDALWRNRKTLYVQSIETT